MLVTEQDDESLQAHISSIPFQVPDVYYSYLFVLTLPAPPNFANVDDGVW